MNKHFINILGVSALVAALLGGSAITTNAQELVKQPTHNGQYRYINPYNSKQVGNPVGSDTMGSSIYAPKNLNRDRSDRQPVVFVHNNKQNNQQANSQNNSQLQSQASSQSHTQTQGSTNSAPQSKNTKLAQTNESTSVLPIIAGSLLGITSLSLFGYDAFKKHA